MAERATVLEFGLRKPAAPIAIAFDAEEITPARLIPGSHARSRIEQQSETFSEGSAIAESSLKSCWEFAPRLLPESLKLLHPSRLGTAVLDLLLISLVFWIANKPITLHFARFSSSAVGFYLLIFLFFAGQGE